MKKSAIIFSVLVLVFSSLCTLSIMNYMTTGSVFKSFLQKDKEKNKEALIPAEEINNLTSSPIDAIKTYDFDDSSAIIVKLNRPTSCEKVLEILAVKPIKGFKVTCIVRNDLLLEFDFRRSEST